MAPMRRISDSVSATAQGQNMRTDIHDKISRASGFSDLDLLPLENAEEAVFSVIEQLPTCTVAQMKRLTGDTLVRVEAVLESLRELDRELSAKPAEALLVTEYLEPFRDFVANDEFVCGSQLHWLLIPAIDTYVGGDKAALDRFLQAQKLVDPIYLSNEMCNPSTPHGLHSESFSSY